MSTHTRTRTHAYTPNTLSLCRFLSPSVDVIVSHDGVFTDVVSVDPAITHLLVTSLLGNQYT